MKEELPITETDVLRFLARPAMPGDAEELHKATMCSLSDEYKEKLALLNKRLHEVPKAMGMDRANISDQANVGQKTICGAADRLEEAFKRIAMSTMRYGLIPGRVTFNIETSIFSRQDSAKDRYWAKRIRDRYANTQEYAEMQQQNLQLFKEVFDDMRIVQLDVHRAALRGDLNPYTLSSMRIRNKGRTEKIVLE